MNAPENKKALGANPNKNFTSCNLAVNEEFAVTGEAMKNTTVALLPELVDGGIRLLVMAGNAGKFDYAPILCSFLTLRSSL